MSSSLPHNELSVSSLVWIGSVLGLNPGRLHAVRLQGSTSTSLFRVYADGEGQQWVLRQFDNADWLAQEPDLVDHESAALEAAAQTNLLVPHLAAVDCSGLHCGVPSLLMTSLPGRVLLKPDDFGGWLRQMAGALSTLHALQPMDFPWRFTPYNPPRKMTVPAWTGYPDLWQRAIEAAQRPWPVFTPCFIHRDYHPVNILFVDQTLSGVVDWPNACLGPSAFDAAWCRINLTLLYGLSAAEEFLQEYRKCGDLYGDFDPYWDLLAVIETLPGPLVFYPPWGQFGMQTLPQTELICRLEKYLSLILERL